MNDYDMAARYAARTDPPGFLRLLLGDAARVTFREWIDTRTLPVPGGRDRTSDLLAGLDPLDADGPPGALLIEFQTRPDAASPERGLEYVALLARELRARAAGTQVVPAAVGLTGPARGSALRMGLPGVPRVFVEVSPAVRTLRDEDAAGTLALIAAGTLPPSTLGWVPLMRGGGESGVISGWVTLAGADPDARRRTDHALIARTFARLTPAVAAWYAALEGFPMEETVPWMEELRTAGEVRGRKADVLRLLNLRFGTLPGPVIAAIDAADDPARLRDWLDALALSATLADWRQAAGV